MLLILINVGKVNGESLVHARKLPTCNALLLESLRIEPHFLRNYLAYEFTHRIVPLPCYIGHI